MGQSDPGTTWGQSDPGTTTAQSDPGTTTAQSPHTDSDGSSVCGLYLVAAHYLGTLCTVSTEVYVCGCCGGCCRRRKEGGGDGGHQAGEKGGHLHPEGAGQEGVS